MQSVSFVLNTFHHNNSVINVFSCSEEQPCPSLAHAFFYGKKDLRFFACYRRNELYNVFFACFFG